LTALLERYGPTALITGASSGLGAQYARYLAARGFSLALVARRQQRLEQLAGELAELGAPQIELLPRDLTAPGACAALAEAVAELDIGLLINNAGMGVYSAFADTALAGQRRMLELNAGVVLELTHRLTPALRARGGGGIVIVSSTTAHLPSPYFSAYAATKAFDLLLAEGLYHELRGDGIDVLAIVPGLTRTEFHQAAGIGTARIPFPFRAPPQVAATTFRHLGRRPAVVDGLGNKLLVLAARVLPRRLFGALTAAFLKP